VLVDRAGATMTELMGSVSRVSDIIAEISHASQEQRAGIEQVNQAIGDMDQVTQQNAALVEESGAPQARCASRRWGWPKWSMCSS
jgi:methyl-accepting chemotaxis protein